MAHGVTTDSSDNIYVTAPREGSTGIPVRGRKTSFWPSTIQAGQNNGRNSWVPLQMTMGMEWQWTLLTTSK